MRKNIFAIIIGLLSIFNMQAQALQDTILTRQLELEREFNPTLRDANKINSLPIVREPQIKKANTQYALWGTRTTPPIEIALPKPGKIMTEIPFSLQKGYLKLNVGNYANIDGALGYNFLNKEKNKVNFMFLHNSSNGTVDYNQEAKLTPSIDMKYMDNFAKLNFTHLFEASEFDIQAAYLHSQFNYFGNRTIGTRKHDNNTQVLNVFNLKAALQNTEFLNVNYKGSFSYHYFTTKYGRTLSDESLGGNQVDGNLDLNTSFMGGDNLMGIKADVRALFYDEIQKIEEDQYSVYTDISNYLKLGATPYIHFEGFNWKLRVGANLDLVIDDENKFYVSPDAELTAKITDKTSLYVNAIGGIGNNTYLDIFRESRYLLPNRLVKHSYTPYEIEGGVKIGEVDGFRFDLFGGHKMTKDEHFLVQQTEYSSNSSSSQPLLTEFLIPAYGELTHSHIGAIIHGNIWTPLDFQLGVKKNFYSVDKVKGIDAPSELEAWNKPALEVNVDATFSATEQLKVILKYYFANERWNIINNQNVKMNDISNLSAGALYNINNNFTLNIKANNLFNQSYDIWQGHPAQGISVMGGFTFKF